MRRRCEKSDSAERVSGTGGVPEELLEFAKSVRIDRVYNLVWYALSPASRGRRISMGYRFFRRPPTFGLCVWGFGL